MTLQASKELTSTVEHVALHIGMAVFHKLLNDII